MFTLPARQLCCWDFISAIVEAWLAFQRAKLRKPSSGKGLRLPLSNRSSADQLALCSASIDLLFGDFLQARAL